MKEKKKITMISKEKSQDPKQSRDDKLAFPVITAGSSARQEHDESTRKQDYSEDAGDSQA